MPLSNHDPQLEQHGILGPPTGIPPDTISSSLSFSATSPFLFSMMRTSDESSNRGRVKMIGFIGTQLSVQANLLKRTSFRINTQNRGRSPTAWYLIKQVVVQSNFTFLIFHDESLRSKIFPILATVYHSYCHKTSTRIWNNKKGGKPSELRSASFTRPAAVLCQPFLPHPFSGYSAGAWFFTPG